VEGDRRYTDYRFVLTGADARLVKGIRGVLKQNRRLRALLSPFAWWGKEVVVLTSDSLAVERSRGACKRPYALRTVEWVLM
jgi:hypothetical protein